MNLSQLNSSKTYLTDKNSIHSYIDHLYNDLFESKKHSATNILEIGVYDGGSILLWRDYFTNAVVDAIDINDCSDKLDNDRINHLVADAYQVDIVSKLQTYDIIVDDGPHTIQSMKFFVENYLNLLKPNGIAIIEDVQDYSWFDILVQYVPPTFSTEAVDLRHVKGRYDDLLLIIRR